LTNLNIYDFSENKTVRWGKVPVDVNYEFTHRSIYTISPTGLGQATHRFFEAIYLNSIPIVKRTNTVFDTLYDIFPCLIINDWEEITVEYLILNYNKTYEKLIIFKNKYPNAFTDINTIEDLLLTI